MKVYLEKDDLYPIYYFETTSYFPHEKSIDIPEEIIEEYRKTLSKIRELNEKISENYDC